VEKSGKADFGTPKKTSPEQFTPQQKSQTSANKSEIEDLLIHNGELKNSQPLLIK